MFTMTKRFNRSKLVPATVFAAALMLAACGSGGGSSSSGGGSGSGSGGGTDSGTGATKTSIEGYWGGPTNRIDPSTGGTFVMAGPILENGEYWFVVSLNGLINSMVHGKGQSANSKFNSTDAKFWGPGLYSAGTLASTDPYVVNSTFGGSVGWKTDPLTTAGWSFSLRYDTIYDTPASNAYVIGNWVGQVQAVSGVEPFRLAVTSAGSAAPVLTMTFVAPSTQAGCIWSGTIAPRASGKNIYDVSMSVGQQAACAFKGLALNGIATPGTNASTGKPRLVLTAIDPSDTYNFIGLIDVAP
jgi:hypothetical protein